jgi:hypothetical protein
LISSTTSCSWCPSPASLRRSPDLHAATIRFPALRRIPDANFPVLFRCESPDRNLTGVSAMDGRVQVRMRVLPCFVPMLPVLNINIDLAQWLVRSCSTRSTQSRWSVLWFSLVR